MVGIVALAPILSAQLDSQRARRSGLDHRAAPGCAPAAGDEGCNSRPPSGDGIEAADGRLPECGPAFARSTPPAGGEAAYATLEDDIVDQIERAATNAFSLPFLAAAAFAAARPGPDLVAAERGR